MPPNIWKVDLSGQKSLLNISLEQAKSYEYYPLDQETKEIRLLSLFPGRGSEEIRCDISRYPMNNLPRYEALSYTWGDAENRESIKLAGSRFEVTKNLSVALCHVRQENEKRILWIDAICIDQNNAEERGLQVSLMRDIYFNADQVLIWLGEEDSTSEMGMSFLKALPVFFKFLWVDGATDKTNEKYLRGLLSRPWFRRIWIIQEVAFAKRGTIICGSLSIDLDTVEEGILEVLKSLGDDQQIWRMPPYLARLTSLLTTRVLVKASLTVGNGEIKGCPFVLVVDKHLERCQATDPRDKIYALLGLSAGLGAPEVTVSYKFSVQQVYAHFVKRMIRKYGDLDIITNWIDVKGAKPGFPSWIPDWSGDQMRASRWQRALGSSSTWGRKGGYSTWTVGINGDSENTSLWSNSGNPDWFLDTAFSTSTQEDEETVLAPEYSSFLTLDGVVVDEISEAPKGGSQNFRSYSTFKDLFLAWEPEDITSGIYLPSGEAKDSAFIQTLLCGNSVDDEIMTPEMKTELARKYRKYIGREEMSSLASDSSSANDAARFDQVLALLQTFLESRAFTVAGCFYALVPQDTEPGDVIVALVGGSVPLVLRRVVYDVEFERQETLESLSLGEIESLANGQSYAGTSRGPRYPVILEQQVLPESSEGNAVVVDANFYLPGKAVGQEIFDPCWKIIGTAYVHGVMYGDLKKTYERGEASMQTYLIV